MPGGDRTGPAGMGPMTGRAAGYCAGNPVPGYMNSVLGRGFGGWGRGGAWGRGGGWGRRNRFYATGLTGWQGAAYGYPPAAGGPYAPPDAPPLTGEREVEMLKGQAKYLKEALSDINKRLEELQSTTEEPSQSS